MFITILLFSLALLTAGSIFGVFFFRRGIEEAYAKIAFYAGLFNADYFDEYMREQFVPKMLEIYESIPEDIAADPKSEAYMEYFETLNDDEKYVHLSEGLRENTSFQDITAMSLNVFDIDSNRLIYLIDTHDGERYHPVGSYRTLSSTSLYDTAASEVEEVSSQRIVHKISVHKVQISLLPSCTPAVLGVKNIAHTKDNDFARFQKLQNRATAKLKVHNIKNEFAPPMQVRHD